MSVALKPSYYNHHADSETPGEAILFNKSWGSIATYEREVSDAVASGNHHTLPGTTVEELAGGGFLVPADLDEIDAAHQRWLSARQANSLLSVTIELTQACNLGCGFCYQNVYRDSASVITDEAIQGVARYVKAVVGERRRPITDVVLRFIGGEPLLQKGQVMKAITAVGGATADAGALLHTQMDTNGTLLDEGVIQQLDTLSVTITNREDHDVQRPKLGGQGSFDQIVGRLRKHSGDFNRYDTLLSVRFNVNATNARHVPDTYRMVKGLGIHSTEFEVYPVINYGFNLPILTLSDQAFRKLFMAVIRLKFEHGEVIRDFPRPTFAPCSAYTPWNLKVAADGRLALCDAMTAPVSSLDELLANIDDYHRIFSKVTSYDPFHDDPCGTCTNVGICGGKYYCKDVSAPDRDPCDFLNYEMDEFLRFFVKAYAEAPHLFDLAYQAAF